MNRDSLGMILPVLGRLLYVYPDHETLESIKNAELMDTIPYESSDPLFKEGQKLLVEWQKSENSYDADISDYQDLFVGVRDRVKTPPWESIYVSPEPMLFGECTLNVRLWYDKYGMEIKNIRHEPDDHMGIELIFLGHLMKENYDDANVFFSEHISLWYEKFFSGMEACAVSNLYKGLALVLHAVCSDMEKLLSAR